MYRVKRVRFNILAASISAFSAKAPCGSPHQGAMTPLFLAFNRAPNQRNGFFLARSYETRSSPTILSNSVA
jgi:hypothetical protein